MLPTGARANQSVGLFVCRWGKLDPLQGQVSERQRQHSSNTLSSSLTPRVPLALSPTSWSPQILLWDSSPDIISLTSVPNRRSGCKHFPVVPSPLHVPPVPVQSITSDGQAPACWLLPAELIRPHVHAHPQVHMHMNMKGFTN